MKFPTVQLTAFAAGRRFEGIPELVVCWAEDQLLDRFGSTVAGHGSRTVASFPRLAQTMGPQTSTGEVSVNRTSACLVGVAHAAASNVAEQDDVHNSAVFPPTTVVFNEVMAIIQTLGAGMPSIGNLLRQRRLSQVHV